MRAIAGGRAGLDHDQRVARFRPHRLGELALVALAELADDVARDDEIGLRDLGEVGGGIARQITAIREARAVARQLEREPAQRGVGVEQRKILQRRKCFRRGPARGARACADVEQCFGSEVRRDLGERAQACGDGRVGRRHARQRIGERIGFRLDRAGAAAGAIGGRDFLRPLRSVGAGKALQPGVERSFEFGGEGG